jgi:hypothetical protein
MPLSLNGLFFNDKQGSKLSLIIAGEAISLLPLKVRLLALCENIRLGWQLLTLTNSLAFTVRI